MNRPKHFLAIRKYKDGGEQTIEYFESESACMMWINRQPQP